MTARFCDISLAVPGCDTFQYSIPENLEKAPVLGDRVFVSMRARKMVGTIVGFSDEKVVEGVKSFDSLVPGSTAVGDYLLRLSRWMADYYQCSWGQAIDAALPAPFKKGKYSIRTTLKKPTASAQILDPEAFKLTEDQKAAFDVISKAISENRHASFLLHGVTGSGKTEVYMHLIQQLLSKGKSTIVLVPEISLTPQALDRFHSRFGDCLAVVHSRLSDGQKVAEWKRISSGEAKVVVGARSAIFSPVKNLGMIVIDEEHEASYKQEETPRYHARHVAAKRCELENAVLLLGSATPSLESYYMAKKNNITMLTLKQRVEKRPMPSVEIVDMRRQPIQKSIPVFSNILERHVREALEKNEQVMLLLNRRGFSTYLHCSSCGYVMTCDNCRVALAYHYDKASLFCHICHLRLAPERLCPGCQKKYLHYFGIGTQKVESEAKRLFPTASICRMDADSTTKKDSHETILRAFKRREIQILIGTQMIAKGHDFPNVSLIGVISADTALHVPDFRSAEKTFDLLTQVAGRAGRGDIPGKVLIQTYVPHHYSIQSVKDHNYVEFFDKEIVFRQELRMPPLTHLANVILAGALEKDVLRQAIGLCKILKESLLTPNFEILGPSPCHVSREGGLYRWHLYVKGKDIESINERLKPVLKQFKKEKITLTVDIDPQ